MFELAPPETAGFSSERLNRISKIMSAYVHRGDLPGIITLVERKVKTVHLDKCGFKDVGLEEPIEFDTLFRIYSMTKPITSVALLMLFEQAQFQLHDPIQKYLPEFKEVQVLNKMGKLEQPKSDITIHQLLTHTAGLTYGVFLGSQVDKLYQEANLFDENIPLEKMVRRIANLPLYSHPGECWRYSVATDVLGRLVEVLSGMSLADYFQEKIFSPLGMSDTTFSVPPEKIDRLSTCYAETNKDKLAIQDSPEKSNFVDVNLFSGGGGLVSTLGDYLKFARLLKNQGEIAGTHLIGRKTWELMTCNHLPASFLPMRNLQTMPGLGFGLGVSVLIDLPAFGALGSVGSFGWSGFASTTFWVDPKEELIAVLMTQFISMEPKPLHMEFRNLVYQALVD